MQIARRRRSIRLPGYDYREAGSYFVTICVQNRELVLGHAVGDRVTLSEVGHLVRDCWQDLATHYPHVMLEDSVIMPNHLHGIVALLDDRDVGAGLKPAPTRHSLSEVIRAFKTFSTRKVNQKRGTPGLRFWQRNFYERIIRDEPEHERIRQYIIENPLRWEEDEYYNAG